MPNRTTDLLLAALLAGLPFVAPAQEAAMPDTVERVTTHMGEMTADMARSPVEIDDALRFEPLQQIEEMFFRDDVVYVMRHGPTDWSERDAAGVEPTDCADQRVMSEEGRARMRDLGTLMASNDVLPSRIVRSEWCRNRQTVEALLEGVARVDPALAEAMPVEVDAGLNLLLSLNGARDASGLRERVSGWAGDPDRPGPLLLVTHYTNIEEMTQFRVFEGEILVLDPQRDDYVLGYLRLRSAAPDEGHFADAMASPLMADEAALDMVSRYYDALNADDPEELGRVVAQDWIDNGSGGNEAQSLEGFLAEYSAIAGGLSDAAFGVDEISVADGLVTVIGTITGRHTGSLFGVPATGRDVAFGSIAVHRVEDGAIVETWQMADRAGLRAQISD